MIWQARSKISFYQTNQVISFASLCTVPLLTVSYLHASLYNCSCSQCSRKISESLQTQVLLVCYLWIHRNIRIASLPSYSPILHGSVSFVPVAARSFLLQSTGFFSFYRPSISQSLV